MMNVMSAETEAKLAKMALVFLSRATMTGAEIDSYLLVKGWLSGKEQVQPVYRDGIGEADE